MKTSCSKCGVPKNPDDFGWRDRSRGVRKRYCRKCQGEYHKRWAAANPGAEAKARHAWRRTNSTQLRTWLREYKDGKPCLDCKKPYPYYVLDFDHREGSTKRGDVAWMTNGAFSLAVLQHEISKCDLVCANCHRERTHKRKQKQKQKAGHPVG